MERMLRAEKLQMEKPAKPLQHHARVPRLGRPGLGARAALIREAIAPAHDGQRGWLLVTDQRLVFADKDRIGSKEYWSVPLHWVESAVAGEAFSFGVHKFVVHYRDDGGFQQKQEFKHINVSKGLLLGPFSKVGANPLAALEQAVNVQVSRVVAVSKTTGTPATRQGSADVAGELERLSALNASGALSDEEIAAAKSLVLSGSATSSTAAEPVEPEEVGPFRYAVELADPGLNKSRVIKLLEDHYRNLGVKEAKETAKKEADEAPVVLEAGLSSHEADRLASLLRAEGAVVNVYESGS